jgi:hypothetical protein
MTTQISRRIQTNMKTKLFLPLLTFLIALAAVSSASAAPRTASVSGNWTNTATWGGSAMPVAGDTVTINTGVTVTVNTNDAQCASVAMGTGAGTATLTFAASGNPKLTVSGAVTVGNAGNANRVGAITFTSGSTLICGSLSLGAIATQASSVNMTAGGTLQIGGTVTVFSGSTWTPGTGSVELTSINTLPTTIFTSFNNLTVSSGTTTLGVNLSVTGNLIVTNTGGLDLNTFTANRSTTGGTFAIASGSSLNVGGTLNFPTNYTTVTLDTASTVTYDNAGAQRVSPQTYGNLVFAGSGAKTNLTGTSIIGNLSILTGVTANVSNNVTVGVGSLTLGGLGRNSGTWGGTGSGASNINTTFFVATTGKLNVTNDNRITPPVTNFPTATAITYGQALSSSTLSGGSAPAGTFAFVTPAFVPTNSGTYSAAVVFTATDTTSYNSTVTSNVNVTVSPKALTMTGLSVPASKTYDGNTTAVVSGTPTLQASETLGTGTTSDGKPFTGDVVSITGTPVGTYNASTVSGASSVVFSGLSLTGANAANYTLTIQGAQAAIITGVAVQLTGTRGYDGTTVASSSNLSVVNNFDGANLTLSGTAAVASKNVGAQAISILDVPARVQSATGSVGASAATSFNVTLAAPQNGNTLIAVIATRGTSTNRVSSITQTGATWTRASQAANANGITTEIWYAPNVSGAGTTVTINQASLLSAAVVMEYSGVLSASSLDQTASAVNGGGNTTAAVTGTTATTTQANELWIGSIGLTSSGFNLTAPLNSFTSVANSASSNGTATSNARVYALERLTNTTAVASSGGTISSSSQFAGAIATFKAELPSGTTLALGGSAAGNYTLTGFTGSLTITNKPLTISGLTASNKVYDATTTATIGGTAALQVARAPGTGTSLDGNPYTGDTVTVGGTPAGAFASSNVGTGISVSVSGVTLSGADAPNYIVTQPTSSANITALTVQLSGTRAYDGTTLATSNNLSLANNLDGTNLTLTGSVVLSAKDVGSRTINIVSTPTRVQSATGFVNASGATTVAVTVTAPTNGNTLVAVISTRGTSTNQVTSISQTGASWIRAAQVANANNSTTEIWYTTNLNSAATGITINLAASLKAAAVVMEYTGLLTPNAVDVTANSTGNSTAAVTGTTITTTQANELWIGGIGLADSANTVGTPNNSFTSVANVTSAGNGTDMRVYALERITNTTATASSGGTVSAIAQWSGVIATFKATLSSGTVLTLGGSAATNYTLAGLTGSVTITNKALTVTGLTANNKTYDATNTATFAGSAAFLVAEAAGTGTTSDGKPYIGDSVPVGGTAVCTFADKTVANAKTVTVTGITTTNTNYTVTQPTLSANITARGLTVTATGVNKIYDGTTNATVTLADNKLSGDVVTDSYTSAAFTTSTAGTGKTINVSGISISGTDSGNYTNNTTATTTANITQATPLVATAFSATAITFGQTLTSSTPTGALTNSLGATVTGAFTFANSGIAPNAGTTNVSVIFTPTDTTDYINVTNTVTVTVNKANQTLAFTSGNSLTKTYGNAPFADVATNNSGGTVTYSSDNTNVATVNGSGTVTIVAAGTAHILADTATTANYNAATQASQTLTVNPLAVALTGTRAYDATTNAAAAILSVNNPVGSDIVTVASGTGGLASKNVGPQSLTSSGNLTLGGTNAANYTLTGASGTVTITTAGLTYTANSATRAYGVANPVFTGSVTNFLGADTQANSTGGTLSFTSSATALSTVGSYAINGSGLSATNYTFTQAAGNATALTITSAVPVITWTNPADITYGTALSGSQLNATSSVAGSFVYSPTNGTVLNAGASQTLSVQFTPTDTTNYSTPSPTTVSINVNKAAQLVGFTLGASVTKNYNDSAFSDTATNSVGNPVTYSSDNTNVATVDGSGTVTIVAAGTAHILADSAATTNYNAASQASQTLTVNGPIASQLVIQTQPSTNATAGVAFAIQPVIRIEDSFGTLVSSDNTTVVTATRLDGNGDLQGTTNLTAVGGVVIFTNLAHNVATNITIQFTASGLTSTNSVVITVAPATADHLVFATQPGAATVFAPFGTQPVVKSQDAFGNDSTNGLPTNLDVDIALTAGTGPLLGTTNFDIGTAAGNGVVTFTNLQIDAAGTDKQLTASATGFTNAVSSVFSVAKLGQSITFDPLADKTYGDSTFGVSATASSGLGVSFSIASGPATILGTNVTITGTGTVTVRASQAGNSAYEAATDVNQSFNVAAKPITVTADAKSKVFGDSDPTFTYVSSDLGATFSGALSRSSGETIGTYAITQGTLSAGTNYSISFVSANLTITAKPITVTADAKSKVYGDSDPTFTYVSSDLGASFSGALSRVTGETVGAYAITQGTLSAGTNYNISFVSADLTITAKPITVTADAKSKVFADSDPTFTYVSSDLGASFSGSLSRTSGETVGAYAITQGTLSAGTNYNISFVSADLTITAKPITVTADAKSKVFGDSDPTLTYVSSDLGASFSGTLSRTSGEDVGNYAITQGTLSAGTNYSISFVSADLTITPKPVSVTLSNLSQVYDGTAKSATATNDPEGLTVLLTYDGSPNYTGSATNNLVITPKPITVTADAKSKVYGASDPSFTYVSSDLGASFSGSLSRTSGETVGNYAITQGTLSAGTNYDITFVSADLTITAKPITVTADAKSKVYGDSDPTFTYVSSDLGASFSGSLSRSTGETVGSYAITQGTLSAGTNYSISFVSANLTITAKPITVTADAKTKAFGDSDPSFTYVSSDLGASFSGSLSRATGETVGSYAITQGSLSAGTNYSISFVSANLTITAKPITVTADAKSKVYGDSDPSFTYVSSDLGASFSGSLSRATGETVGSYAITQGTLSAGTNYSISFVSANLTITAVTLTVTAENQTTTYGDEIPTLTYTISGFVNGDTTNVVAGTADISTEATNGSNAGTYSIVVTNGTLSATNYSFAFTNGTLTVEKFTVYVTADDETRAYGTANPTFTANYSVLANGDDWDVLSGFPTVGTAATAGSPIGTYPITVANGSLSATNYQFEFVDGTLTVTKSPLSVTADTKTKVFGDSDPAFTYSITSGALYGSDSLTGVLDRVAGEAVGAYAITQGTLTAGTNYLLSFISTNLNITPASLTGSVASSLNPAQPGSNVTFTATLTVVSPGAGIPSGSVQFKVDGSAYGSPATLTSGVATLATTTLPHGSHTVTAEFATAGNFFGTTNALSPNQIINAAPTTTSDTLATHQDHAVSAAAFKLALNDSDPDLDALTVTGVSATSTQGGTVALASGTLTYTPPSGFSGADSFTYTVSDTFSATASGTVNVTVYSSTNQPERVVSLTTLGDNNKKITFAGIPSYSYVVQASTNLTSWIPVSTNSAGTNGLFIYNDLTATNYANRYYRSVAP